VAYHDGVVEVQCHDLELDASIVFADPDQASVRGSGRRHVVGHDGVEHELRVGLANAVASRRAIPPKRSVHILVWHRNTIRESGATGSVIGQQVSDRAERPVRRGWCPRHRLGVAIVPAAHAPPWRHGARRGQGFLRQLLQPPRVRPGSQPKWRSSRPRARARPCGRRPRRARPRVLRPPPSGAGLGRRGSLTPAGPGPLGIGPDVAGHNAVVLPDTHTGNRAMVSAANATPPAAMAVLWSSRPYPTSTAPSPAPPRTSPP